MTPGFRLEIAASARFRDVRTRPLRIAMRIALRMRSASRNSCGPERLVRLYFAGGAM